MSVLNGTSNVSSSYLSDSERVRPKYRTKPRKKRPALNQRKHLSGYLENLDEKDVVLKPPNLQLREPTRLNETLERRKLYFEGKLEDPEYPKPLLQATPSSFLQEGRMNRCQGDSDDTGSASSADLSGYEADEGEGNVELEAFGDFDINPSVWGSRILSNKERTNNSYRRNETGGLIENFNSKTKKFSLIDSTRRTMSVRSSKNSLKMRQEIQILDKKYQKLVREANKFQQESLRKDSIIQKSLSTFFNQDNKNTNFKQSENERSKTLQRKSDIALYDTLSLLQIDPKPLLRTSTIPLTPKASRKSNMTFWLQPHSTVPKTKKGERLLSKHRR